MLNLNSRNLQWIDLTGTFENGDVENGNGHCFKLMRIVDGYHRIDLKWYRPDGLVAFPQDYCQCIYFYKGVVKYVVTNLREGEYEGWVESYDDAFEEATVSVRWAYQHKSGVMMAARYFIGKLQELHRVDAAVVAAKRALLKGGTGSDKSLFSLPAA